MTNEDRATKYAADIKTALRKFGEYNFFDKGPREVMSRLDADLKVLVVTSSHDWTKMRAENLGGAL
jgi:hypothetical protein